MSYRNYRIIRKEENGAVTYTIHEVYYNDKNKIESRTEDAVLPSGETFSELRNDVFYFMSAFKYPVLKQINDGEKDRLVEDEEDQEINPGHYFELMDRASVVLGHFDDFVASHPVVRKNDKLKESAQKIIDALYGFYSEAAGAWDEEDVKEESKEKE